MLYVADVEVVLVVVVVVVCDGGVTGGTTTTTLFTLINYKKENIYSIIYSI